MARWFKSKDDSTADYARVRVVNNLSGMQERDDEWIALVSDVSGLVPQVLWDNIAQARENMLLATLIGVYRRSRRANAVLQVLVHSPPLWNLLKELGELKGQRGAGGAETGVGTTPLVDASVRLFEEFAFKEEPPPTRQLPHQAPIGKPGEHEEKKENNVAGVFEPTYMYDAMKEKRQLKSLLVRSLAT